MMEEGEFKRRIAEQSFSIPNGPDKVVFKGYVDDLIDEAKKEFWECCTGYTNVMQNDIQFVKRTYQFNADALANWALKWFGR